MGTVIIRYTDMPCYVKGYVAEDGDGDYNVYINSRLPCDVQQKALAHELDHISNCDFDNGLSIARVEGLMA